jgi:hypothetical protein
MTDEPIYCIDTSSLLEAWGYAYRPKSFPSFWERMEHLIADGRCVIAEEVQYEVEDDANDLISWVKKQHKFVVDYDRNQELVVKEIMRKYPRLINLKKNKGWADPFVIALAKVFGHTVITEEKRGVKDPPRIPFVCQEYCIPCMNLAEMIEQEGWTF